MLSLNSTSYCLRWRPNAGPDGPCWDPLGYFFCSLIFKKFWSSLFQKIINFDSRTEHQQFTTLFTDVSQARRTAHYHERWMLTRNKTKHWHRVLLEENISGQIRQPKRSEAAAALCLQAQPVARLKMFSQQGHAHRAHIHTTDIHIYIHIYGWTYRSQTDTLSTHTNT